MQMFTKNKTAMLDMFLDRTAGEAYADNRLTTQTNDAGNVELVAYNWLKLAEYNEDREAVTVFTGHREIDSRVVSRYLNDVIRRAEERGRAVILSGESPVDGQPNAGVKYINNYVDFSTPLSSVESGAVAEVRESLL